MISNKDNDKIFLRLQLKEIDLKTCFSNVVRVIILLLKELTYLKKRFLKHWFFCCDWLSLKNQIGPDAWLPGNCDLARLKYFYEVILNHWSMRITTDNRESRNSWNWCKFIPCHQKLWSSSNSFLHLKSSMTFEKCVVYNINPIDESFQ